MRILLFHFTYMQGFIGKRKKKKPKGTTTLGFTHNLTKFGKWCRGEETKEKGSGRPEVVNCEKVSFSWKLKG